LTQVFGAERRRFGMVGYVYVLLCKNINNLENQRLSALNKFFFEAPKVYKELKINIIQ
jgi:hypothetical protein